MLNYIGDRAIGLNGVIDHVGIYPDTGIQKVDFKSAYLTRCFKKTGFKPVYRTCRFQLKKELSKCQWDDSNITIYRPELLATIADFDQRFFPARRQSFLNVWLSQPQAVVRVAWDNDNVTGYIVLRPCHQGAKVGPLFAESIVVAKALLLEALHELQRFPIYIDMLEVNSRAMALAADLNMKLVWETLRMYTRMPREIELDGVFGLTNIETG